MYKLLLEADMPANYVGDCDNQNISICELKEPILPTDIAITKGDGNISDIFFLSFAYKHTFSKVEYVFH